ncbi:ORF19 [Felid gammaherpesvirus 1]|uniref:ORF19 n=1 Tax=Felid gammaherpesvirus 1 TaxID=2560468 RepID=A0A0M4M4G8_9GAMA|nr:ORF19 [Felis catus gammaherpesvirus 1]ALE14730.1 ORF19 [Felis catus gammaherpesvirus 1]
MFSNTKPHRVFVTRTLAPNKVLHINRDLLTETRRYALKYRRHVLEQHLSQVKKGLLRAELEALAQGHISTTQDVLQKLDTLESVTQHLSVKPIQSEKVNSLKTAPTAHTKYPTQRDKTSLIITIAPDDPSFHVESDFRGEFLSGLYTKQHQWLPAFGPWFTNMTDSAMQRRVFPRELRGNLNLQSSTSLKLMQAVLDTISNVTSDFFLDVRHLSDTNSALCLLNGYFYIKKNSPLPLTYVDLVSNLDEKIELLITDLKQNTQGTNFSFSYSNPQQLETIAPLSKQNTYSTDFFQDHKLFHLLVTAGVLPSQTQSKASQNLDVVYLITNTVFGADIPPFPVFQWNLRTGLIALEVLMLVYITLEVAQISTNTAHRRLQLATLLGGQIKTKDSQQYKFLKRKQLFSFMCENYMIPTLQQNPQTPISSLFPGIILTAIEAVDVFDSHINKTNNHIINLSGKKYNEMFDIINQKYTFKDPQAILHAQTAFRLTIEKGLNLLLSSTNPSSAITKIISTEFGGGDDYDNLYFLILGCLPVSVAII